MSLVTSHNNHPGSDLSHMHVVCMVSNPVRFKSRFRLWHAFQAHMRCLGATLWTCEIAYGHRPFELTSENDPHALRLRTTDEVWHKENALNLIIQRLPIDCRYVCWVDADITFTRHDVLQETWHQLQHHPVVQMWSSATDLDPNGRIMSTATSFAARYLDGNYTDPCGTSAYAYAHPGYAWAARRDFIDTVGGLLDFAPLGSADFYMALAIIQGLTPHLEHRRKQGFSDGYIRMLAAWQERAAAVKADLGVVEGTIAHHWHGKKRQRQYNTREEILIRNKFDPIVDLKRDWQGLWALSDHNPRLRFDIRQYHRSRHEDSIDL